MMPSTMAANPSRAMAVAATTKELVAAMMNRLVPPSGANVTKHAL